MMRREIERKFLLRNDRWRDEAHAGQLLRQGYMGAPDCTVRVRSDGTRGYLTIKGPTSGAARDEFEYPIPLADAHDLLERYCAKPPIVKTRYRVPAGGLVWEIDEFHGSNRGLIMAEVELDREDRPLELPDWIGEEVTHDRRYRNAYLARHPYGTWSANSAPPSHEGGPEPEAGRQAPS